MNLQRDDFEYVPTAVLFPFVAHFAVCVPVQVASTAVVIASLVLSPPVATGSPAVELASLALSAPVATESPAVVIASLARSAPFATESPADAIASLPASFLVNAAVFAYLAAQSLCLVVSVLPEALQSVDLSPPSSLVAPWPE